MQNKSNKFQFLVIILFFISANMLAQTWITGPWTYRREISLNNPGVTALNNYQIKISLDSSFDFNSTNYDGSDLRFTNTDQITLLSHWIEEWNPSQNWGIVWVKIPSLQTGTSSIYLYYGNSIAANHSNGYNTFDFFDDFENGTNMPGRWAGFVQHELKNSMEFLHGALEYAMRNRSYNWNLENIDNELEQEFDFLHSLINPDGSVVPDSSLLSEPQYCYGLILSNLASGHWYFNSYNSTLANRCYTDMVLVFDNIKSIFPNVTNIYDKGGYGWLQVGLSNAWRSFNDVGDEIRKTEISNIIQNQVQTFLNNQNVNGSWNGALTLEEQLKRNLGILWSEWVVKENTLLHNIYLNAVKNNIEYILNNHYVLSNGGLETFEVSNLSDRFYEYYQTLFMVTVRRLAGRSGSQHDYTPQSLQTWLFLTDNNYAGIDLFVHNYLNHNSFFSYRDVKENGLFQTEDYWKGSHEVGTALWSMTLNYDWVSNYQSSHSPQSFNYLDMLAKEVKKSSLNGGFFSSSGNWISRINWNAPYVTPDTLHWMITGQPNIKILPDNNSMAAVFTGLGTHNDFILSKENNFDDFILEMKIKLASDLSGVSTPEIGFRYSNFANRYTTLLRGESQNDLIINRYQDSVITSPNSFPSFNYNANTYYRFGVAANNNLIQEYIDNSLINEWNDAGSNILNGAVTLSNFGNTNVFFDDIRIRNFALIEPVVTVSNTRENNPLPVELASFSAHKIGSKIKLSWQTETETNNFGFEIERCKQVINNNTQVWKKIGFVNGSGNSNTKKSYNFIDDVSGILNETLLYRLKQIDNDGKYEFSKTISINSFSSPKFELEQNYPNPFNPITKISYSIKEQGLVTLKVYDILGKEVATLVNENKPEGNYLVEFDASDIPSGIYVYAIQAGDYKENKKMLLLK